MSVQQYCYVGPYFEMSEEHDDLLGELYNQHDEFAIEFQEDLFFRPLENKNVYIPNTKEDWAFEYAPYFGKYEYAVVNLDAQVISDALHKFTDKYNDVFLTLEKMKVGIKIHYGVINYMF